MTTSVDITTSYPLTDDAVQRFANDGYLRLSGVLTPGTVEYYEEEITREILALNLARIPLEERSTYHRAFLQVTNLWRRSQRAKELVFSRRLSEIASRLLRTNGVRLYQDQALYKEPSGGITPWHADQYYWPFNSDRTVTIWIPLQDTPLEMGSLEFARSSHRFEFGRDLPISDESEASLQKALAEQGFVTDRAAYALGDASFHLGWTFHRAGRNLSTRPRRVMTIIYIDADIRVAEPANEAQQTDLEVLMPGAQVGDVPDTEMNPVLYRRS